MNNLLAAVVVAVLVVWFLIATRPVCGPGLEPILDINKHWHCAVK